jgi:hypothetical protein
MVGVVRRARVVVRAQLAAWRGQARRSRRLAASVALVIAGLAGALAGGWLIGRWCLGLVLIAESAGVLAAGLLREDGRAAARRGRRTVGQALEDHDARWPL